MNEKKNIDRLFQEKFKDFEAVPNDDVWNRISESLPKKKKKRRIIAIWWQVGGIAAAIAILITVGNSVFNLDNDSIKSPVIVDTEESKNKDDHNASSQNKEKEANNAVEIELVNSENNNESLEDEKNINTNKLTHPNSLGSNAVVNYSNKKESTTSSQKHKSLTFDKTNKSKVASNKKNIEDNYKAKLTNDNKKSIINEAINNKNTSVTDNTISRESEISNSENTDTSNTSSDIEKEALFEDINKESIEEAIAAQDHIDEKEKEDDVPNKWSIAPNVAPVYFSSLGKGSTLDRQFNENAKSSDINMSYGITGTYALSHKLKLRAGINRVNLSQTTSNVFTFTGGGEFASRNTETQSGNINANGELANLSLISANIFDTNTTPEIFNTKIAGNIDQRFGFIEVPLELEYRLVDQKIGLNLIGGFSTFFLNQNEIYADINGTSILIGEASNINSTSFSANFGLGMDYKLSKQWNINLEPQFKYQINTFNNTSGNFRPFFIGVYTGLSFKF